MRQFLWILENLEGLPDVGPKHKLRKDTSNTRIASDACFFCHILGFQHR